MALAKKKKRGPLTLQLMCVTKNASTSDLLTISPRCKLGYRLSESLDDCVEKMLTAGNC